MRNEARILIAGCGDLGNAAAELLCAAGHTVFGARRNVTALAPSVRPVAIDLLGDDLTQLPERLDAVVWALAPQPSEAGYRSAYVDAPRRLLAHLVARGDPIARAVLVGSTSVWSRSDGAAIDERTPAKPANFRGAAILAGEQVFATSGLRSVSLRLAGIYGPGRTRLIDGIRSGRIAPPDRPVFGNRIWRDDAAAAVVQALQLDDPAPVYTVVDDEPADLREVYEWLAQRLAVPLPDATAGFAGRGGSKRCRNELLRGTGWRPRVPSYREGYARLLPT